MEVTDSALYAAENKLYVAKMAEEGCKLLACCEGHTASITGVTNPNHTHTHNPNPNHNSITGVTWSCDDTLLCTCSQAHTLLTAQPHPQLWPVFAYRTAPFGSGAGRAGAPVWYWMSGRL